MYTPIAENRRYRAVTTSRLRRAPFVAIAAVPLLIFAVGGCGSILEVDLPGQLTSDDLNDPELAETLVLGAETDFYCGLSGYFASAGLWTSEFHFTGTAVEGTNFSARAAIVEDYGNLDCNSYGLWLPLQRARFQAEDAIERIQTFADEDVANKDFLLGKAFAFAGYSYQMLGEAFCELHFNVGPAVSREGVFGLAEERFTSALDFMGRVGSGAKALEAASFINLARVGRARARLNGGFAGVVADASLVDVDFVFEALYDSHDTFRRNQIGRRNVRGSNMSASLVPGFPEAIYVGLEVQGVPDPRVQVAPYNGEVGSDGHTPHYVQLKYAADDSPIPFATWREAQIMIAEVTGGQTAVDIINMLRDTHSLPNFASTVEAEIRAQVIEERRRELWMQGTRLGDIIRHNIALPTGVMPDLNLYHDESGLCVPVPIQEAIGNPNIK